MASSSPSVRLQPRREKSLLRKHPWVFSGSIASVSGSPDLGETVAVLSHEGIPLGWGAFSPHSQIRVRLWTTVTDTPITVDWLTQAIQSACRRRDHLTQQDNLTLYRLINAEGDGLPGLIVDRYGDWLVCQFLSAGAEFWKAEIVSLLAELWPCQGIYERSDGEVRRKEGLPSVTGSLYGEEPPPWIEVLEYGCRFAVDVRQGHKTGFYLDQRLNRRAVLDYVEDQEVLNCFAYTGGFAVWAGQGGAKRITNVEASTPALDLAAHNLALNHLPESEAVNGDVFQVLRHYRDQERRFDVIILDPPKFADSQGQVDRACRGYKDINWLAMRLLRPGGFLMTFSCSGLISAELFQKVVAGACLDAGREADIIQRLGQADDHAVPLHFPEGEYLKGLICRVR